jgi:hypothetical protein
MVGGRDCQADFAHHQFQIVPHHKATYLFTIQLLTKNSLSFPQTAVISSHSQPDYPALFPSLSVPLVACRREFITAQTELLSQAPVTFSIFSCFLHIQPAAFQAPRQSRPRHFRSRLTTFERVPFALAGSALGYAPSITTNRI